LWRDLGTAGPWPGKWGQPFRSPWGGGMKIRDLIPDKAYLMWRASVKRQNEVMLSDDDRLAANADGFPDETSAQQPKYLAQGARQGAQGASARNAKEVRDNADSLADRIGNLVDEINLDYAVIERVDAANVSVKLLPFRL